MSISKCNILETTINELEYIEQSQTGNIMEYMDDLCKKYQIIVFSFDQTPNDINAEPTKDSGGNVLVYLNLLNTAAAQNLVIALSQKTDWDNVTANDIKIPLTAICDTIYYATDNKIISVPILIKLESMPHICFLFNKIKNSLIHNRKTEKEINYVIIKLYTNNADPFARAPSNTGEILLLRRQGEDLEMCTTIGHRIYTIPSRYDINDNGADDAFTYILDNKYTQISIIVSDIFQTSRTQPQSNILNVNSILNQQARSNNQTNNFNRSRNANPSTSPFNSGPGPSLERPVFTKSEGAGERGNSGDDSRMSSDSDSDPIQNNNNNNYSSADEAAKAAAEAANLEEWLLNHEIYEQNRANGWKAQDISTATHQAEILRKYNDDIEEAKIQKAQKEQKEQKDYEARVLQEKITKEQYEVKRKQKLAERLAIRMAKEKKQRDTNLLYDDVNRDFFNTALPAEIHIEALGGKAKSNQFDSEYKDKYVLDTTGNIGNGNIVYVKISKKKFGDPDVWFYPLFIKPGMGQNNMQYIFQNNYIARFGDRPTERTYKLINIDDIVIFAANDPDKLVQAISNKEESDKRLDEKKKQEIIAKNNNQDIIEENRRQKIYEEKKPIVLNPSIPSNQLKENKLKVKTNQETRNMQNAKYFSINQNTRYKKEGFKHVDKNNLKNYQNAPHMIYIYSKYTDEYDFWTEGKYKLMSFDRIVSKDKIPVYEKIENLDGSPIIKEGSVTFKMIGSGDKIGGGVEGQYIFYNTNQDTELLEGIDQDFRERNGNIIRIPNWDKIDILFSEDENNRIIQKLGFHAWRDPPIEKNPENSGYLNKLWNWGR